MGSRTDSLIAIAAVHDGLQGWDGHRGLIARVQAPMPIIEAAVDTSMIGKCGNCARPGRDSGSAGLIEQADDDLALGPGGASCGVPHGCLVDHVAESGTLGSGQPATDRPTRVYDHQGKCASPGA